jgi:hypothetical protein
MSDNQQQNTNQPNANPQSVSQPQSVNSSSKNDGKAKADAGDFALPKQQQLSTGQQIMIWMLIIVVGVLFGMGSTVPFLGEQGARYIGSVGENEILMRQNIARRLQSTINPSGYPGGGQFEPSPYDNRGRPVDVFQVWADRIRLSRYAEEQGFMPAGEALDGIVKEFLNRKLASNEKKRYADAINEAVNTDKEVTLNEVRRFLAEETARELVRMANVIVPVVPTVMADTVAAMPALSQQDYYSGKLGDQVVVDEVVLNATALLPEIKEDDGEINVVYERLKATRFARPARVEATIASADMAALTAAAVVTDSDIEAYYNAHKDDYRKPAAPVTPKPDEKPAEPVVEYKPIAEVSFEIKQKLAKERAELKAKELVKAFDAAAEEVLEQKDNTSFKALAAKMGLQTVEKIMIDEAKSGATLDAGQFGQLSESQLHLFTQDIHSITSAVQSTGDKATWLVLRIDARHPSGFKELSDPQVKKDVIAVLKGERAHKDFIAQAEALRVQIEATGPGGLKKWAESEAAKKWSPIITSNTLSATNQITPPPAEARGLASGDAKLLASLAVAARPVALGDSPAKDDVPTVRLVQATDYQKAPTAHSSQAVEYAGTFRDFLLGYRAGIFNRELGAQLQDK